MSTTLSVHREHHHSMKWWYALVACMVMLCMESAAAVAQSGSDDDIERQVKAAYLYKFGSYVEWPERAFATPGGHVRIGIIGANPLADELSQMVAGRVINGRQITVYKLKPGDSLTGIHILFIAGTSNDRLSEILAVVKGQPTLTITESEQGLALGGMINFLIVSGKLRFEVAPKMAQQGSLNISARLLSAAFKVAGAP
jgi:hypothetical protein